MSNKSVGTAFEKEFAEILSGYGFWVHRMQDNQNGQPFDLIAAKNGRVAAIDCKDCEGDRFYLRRMEENQRSAMERWLECGNDFALFAVRYPGHKIRFYRYEYLTACEEHGIRFVQQGNDLTCTIEVVMRAFADESID